MTIYLFRHGEAEPETADPRRPLTERGRSETQRVAVFLKNAGVEAEEIIHSAKLRARQTAEILKNELNPAGRLIEKDGLAPTDSIEKIYNWLLKSKKDVLIVGHLPFLDKLVSRLVTSEETQRIVKFPESAVAILEQDALPLWRISGYITPQMINSQPVE